MKQSTKKFNIDDEDNQNGASILNTEFKNNYNADTLSNLGSIKSKKTVKIKSRSVYKKKKQKPMNAIDISPRLNQKAGDPFEIYQS